MQNFGSGHEDGYYYSLDFENNEYIITVIDPFGIEHEEKFRCSYEPVLGPDVADICECETILDDMLKKLKI
jgi:hypothetical protein